jgi:DnaJ-class molecular chaperone
VPFRTAISGGTLPLTFQRPGGKVETIHVKIPAGTEDGQKLRLHGQGGESRFGGPPGDMLVQVRVQPHPFFRRKKRDLEVEVPVTLAEAGLGAKVDVPTPKGVISLKVPPATSSGRRLRIKGHGVAPEKGPAGDLYVIISIVLPESIDEQSADLIRRFDQQNPQHPRTDLRW